MRDDEIDDLRHPQVLRKEQPDSYDDKDEKKYAYELYEFHDVILPSLARV